MSFQPPSRVLVICIGNMCRSPVAEYLLRHYAQKSKKSKIQQIVFESAGTMGGYGGMDEYSLRFLKQKGINALDFQSRMVHRSIVNVCDLILTMTSSLKTTIIEEYFWNISTNPTQYAANVNVSSFKEAAGQDGDVDDPVGYNWNEYLDVMLEIDGFAQKIIQNWERLM